METQKARRAWNNALQVQNIHSSQPRPVHPTKLSFPWSKHQYNITSNNSNLEKIEETVLLTKEKKEYMQMLHKNYRDIVIKTQRTAKHIITTLKSQLQNERN